jgi:hypothetical protein
VLFFYTKTPSQNLFVMAFILCFITFFGIFGDYFRISVTGLPWAAGSSMPRAAAMVGA